MKTIRLGLLIASLVCVTTASVVAQDETGTKPKPSRGEPLGQVTSLRGKGPKVSRANRPGVPLKVGDVLRPGDHVSTGNATLEVTLGDPKRSEGRDRIALGKRTRALLGGPDDPADLSLEEGEVFGVSSGELRVRAGRNLVTLRQGDARVELSRKGALVVEVHWGFVAMVTGGGEEVGLKGGDRVRVDPRGRAGRTKRFTPRPSKWLASLRFVDPRAVLFHVGFDDAQAMRELESYKGTLQGAGTIKATTGDRYSAQRVVLEHSAPKGGMFRCSKGTRIRVRYRVSAPTTVTVQSWSSTRKENFRVNFRATRAGVWSEVEYPIERLCRTGSKPGPDRTYLRAGDHMTSLSVYAGKRGEAVILEVDEILVFDPVPSR